MDLKSTLKSLKLNESTVSMVLGAIVIVVVGLLVVNYFRNVESGETFPDGANTQNQERVTLPTTHRVEAGETLWTISQKYYGSGYNWVDIAEANELSRADVISEGQELNIPDVEAKGLANAEATQPGETVSPSPTATIAATVSPSPTLRPTATVSPRPTASPEGEQMAEQNEGDISGNTYTVVRGDNLWDIAVRAYGNGYRWVEIARENNLVNPNIIHPGNVLTLPR